MSEDSPRTEPIVVQEYTFDELFEAYSAPDDYELLAPVENLKTDRYLINADSHDFSDPPWLADELLDEIFG